MNSNNICFIERCPRCLKTAEFKYATGRVAFFGKKYVTRITCSSCRSIFQNEDPVEGEKLLRIAEIYQSVTSSEISLDEGLNRMDAEGSTLLGEIRAGSQTWICDKCEEENYASVGECWKCQNEHPHLKDLEPDELGGPAPVL
jgi:transposase-like protein